MNFAKIAHRARRVFELGPVQTTKIYKKKFKQRYFLLRWKQKAINKHAAHSWHQIAKKHGFTLSFGQFFLLLKNKTFLFHEDFKFRDTLPDTQEKSVTLNNPLTFYNEIKIQRNTRQNLAPDIQEIWHLGRCQDLPGLGALYAATGDAKSTQEFVTTITTFIKENPYLLGANWYNAMEVAVRAINWIHAFAYFKDAPEISAEFWQQFVCSLYDHLHYIENNFEWYDGKTNNHYLTNLVGYYYLCWFFSDLRSISKKQHWCYKEFLKELDKQVFAEGSCYEGSTAYHQLNTQATQLFFQLCATNNVQVPALYQQKLRYMLEFLWWCTPNNGALIKIGDDDSSTLLADHFPSPTQPTNQVTSATFEQFGISIIKTPVWHISLRRHAYTTRQTSGHFHSDILSVTVAVNGIPLFVDPATYVYTPSIWWRNYFRSVERHNTFYLRDQQPISLTDDIFTLDIPANLQKIHKNLKHNQLFAQHRLYPNLCANRLLTLNNFNNLTITDWWEFNKQPNTTSCWNFTLHPEIKPIFERGSWQLYHHDKPIAQFDSQDLDFKLEPGWVSLVYGTKVATQSLRSQAPVDYGTKSMDLSFII